MKKGILAIAAAGVLVIGLAGQSMAAFTTGGELVRTIFDSATGQTTEIGSDMGVLNGSTTAAYGTNQAVGDSITLNAQLAGDLSSLKLSYYGMNYGSNTNGVGQYWITGSSSTGVVVNAKKGSNLFGLQNTPNLYNSLGGTTVFTATTVDDTTAKSYYRTMESNGTAPGTFGNTLYTGVGNATVGLDTLASAIDHYIDTDLFYVNYTATNNSGTTRATGTKVATIRTSLIDTNLDGIFGDEGDTITTTINATDAPAVPVPPSVLLLGTGLLGLVGLRKKNRA